MVRKHACPQCRNDARWVGMTMECRYGSQERIVDRIDTFYCPSCDSFWDVPIAESDATEVCSADGARGIERGRRLHPLKA